MHAWNPDFFKLISHKFGKILKIDEDTITKEKVHRARILIKTPYSELPKDPFPVMVDGRKFSIRIKEELEEVADEYAEWSEEEVLDSDEDLDEWWCSDDEESEGQEMEEEETIKEAGTEEETSENNKKSFLAIGCIGKSVDAIKIT
ncbi:hypothetical protein ACS0TY_024175 [Phlomoides rotata]